jgi:hypothetical protein
VEQPERHAHIEFFVDAIKNSLKTLEQGRPIFDEVEMVRVRFVGDSKSEFVERASSSAGIDRQTKEEITYAQRYPEHYAVFKGQRAALKSGTRLEDLPGLSTSKAAELRALNILSVEDLAGLSDEGIKRLGMQGRALVERAKAWLGQTTEHAATAAMMAENAKLQEQIDAMKAMIEGMRQAPAAPSDVKDGFEEMGNDELKSFIRDCTGGLPRGNPSRETLLRQAREAHALVHAQEEQIDAA